MKISGQKIVSSNLEIVIIPRPDIVQKDGTTTPGDLVFKCAAVKGNFEKVIPPPVAPMKMAPGGAQSPDFADSDYKKAVEVYSKSRVHWLILKSLEATPDLEWETVVMTDPATFENYVKEFEEAGITEIEMSKIVEGVMIANCLSENKLADARRRFFLMEGQAKPSTSPMGGQ